VRWLKLSLHPALPIATVAAATTAACRGAVMTPQTLAANARRCQVHRTALRSAAAPRADQKNKTIYRMVMEEDGANKTTMFTPADLHDDQVGDDRQSRNRNLPLARQSAEPPQR